MTVRKSIGPFPSPHAGPKDVKPTEITRDKKIVWTHRDENRPGIRHFQILDTVGGEDDGGYDGVAVRGGAEVEGRSRAGCHAHGFAWACVYLPHLRRRHEGSIGHMPTQSRGHGHARRAVPLRRRHVPAVFTDSITFFPSLPTCVEGTTAP